MAIDSQAAKDRVNALRQRIIDPEDEDDLLSPEDRNVLIEFDNKLTRDRKDRNRCGWYHHANLLSRLYILSSHTDALAASLDEDRGQEAVDEMTDWIHDQDYSGYTVQGLLSTIRVFADTVLDVDEEETLPKRFANIEPGEHVDEDRSPLPSNVVEYADMIEMVEAVDHPRDKALIATQWDAGMRPMEELYTLQFSEVSIEDDHVVITLPTRDGKTERRDILVVVGAPLLKKWILQEHPVHDDPEDSLGPDTFIWTEQDKNRLPQYDAIGERFRVAGRKADLTKDHSAQHLRRSAASILAGQPHISERDLRYRFDWAPSSPAPEHYIAAFSESTQVNVARCRGREVENINESPDTAPVPCGRCGQWTLRGLDECVWCHLNRDDEQLTLNQHQMQNPHTADEMSFEEKILNGVLTADDLRVLKEVKPNVLAGEDVFENIEQQIVRADALEQSRDDGLSAVVDPATAVAYASAAGTGIARRWAQAKHAAMTIHPGLEHYPPSPQRGAGIVAGQLGIVAVTLVTLWATGALEALLAGDVFAVAGAVIALVVGAALVARDLPTIDESIEELENV